MRSVIRRRWRATAAAAWMSLCLGSAASAIDLDALLNAPVSAGSIALLVEHTADPRAQARLIEALKDSRADVRTVTARVMFASSQSAFVPPLLAALAVEADKLAGLEEIRTLLTIGGPAHDEAVIAAALRLNGVAPGVAVDTLARLRAGRLMTFASRLLGTAASPALARASFLLDDGTREVLWKMAIDRKDERFVVAALGSPRADTIDARSLSLALASQTPDIRLSTLWHVAMLAVAEPPVAIVPRAELTTLLASPTGDAPTDALVRFLLELLDRRKAEALSKEDWPAVIRARQPLIPGQLRESRLLLRMTEDELLALGAASWSAESLRFINARDDLRDGRPPRSKVPVEGPRELRTVSPFVAGLAQQLMTIADCRPRDMAVGVAEFRYMPSGRKTAIKLSVLELSPACQQVARALVLLDVPAISGPLSPDLIDTIVVRLAKEAVACLDQGPDPPEKPAPRIGSGHIKAPKKTRDTKPIYPHDRIAARTEGMVILNGRISATGCMQSLEVLSSPHPRLSLAALMAAAQWQYEPTLVEDKPVPVIMTVTVNFILQR